MWQPKGKPCLALRGIVLLSLTAGLTGAPVGSMPARAAPGLMLRSPLTAQCHQGCGEARRPEVPPGNGSGSFVAASTEPPTWALLPSPGPKPGERSYLEGISCAKPSLCMAVGSDFGPSANLTAPVAERWDGRSWSLLALPRSEGEGSLQSISCVSVTFCMAVGSYYVQSHNLTAVLAERWDGTSWSVVPNPLPPAPGAAAASMLLGVSCANPAFCVAVGGEGDTPGSDSAIVESWDGHAWSVLKSPSLVGASLTGVSCTSPGFCFAVGTKLSCNALGCQRAFAERWDGKSWQVAPSPSLGQVARTTAVSCVSTTFCAATGSWWRGPSAQPRPLVEFFDGSAWTVSHAHLSNESGAALNAVACASPTWCVAVGGAGTQQQGKALVETYSAGTWSAMPSTTTPEAPQDLWSVACVRAGLCVAAGYNQQRGSILASPGFASSAHLLARGLVRW